MGSLTHALKSAMKSIVMGRLSIRHFNSFRPEDQQLTFPIIRLLSCVHRGPKVKWSLSA
jgi:hypothetical protein